MKQFWAITALLIIIIIGTALRVDNINERTIGHIETYVPGIDLPPDRISIPRLRITLLQTISHTIGEEVHPPAYYVIMFPWTKIFGTGIISIRLPSVLFGILSILLIYILCIITEDKLTGILAAGMLALNGLHIYWSQIAKFYSMACFLGLLSTVLLVLILKSDKYQRKLLFLYLVVTLTGLATVIYFWPIFATHIIWIFFSNLSKKRDLLGIFRFQILIFILGSPLWAIAAYQSKRPAYLEKKLLMPLIHFIQFGFLFEPEPYTGGLQISLPTFVTIGLIMFASFLFIMGIITGKNRIEGKEMSNGWPSTIFMIFIGIICFLSIMIFAKLAHAKDPSRTRLIILTGFIPLVLPFFYLMSKRYWSNLKSFGTYLNRRFPLLNLLNSINTLLAILPAIIIAGLSFKTPLFVSRGVLLFIPYFIIVLCRGLASLVRRHSNWGVLIIILTIIHVFSLVHWHSRLRCPINYKELYEKWEPNIKTSDMIFVQRSFAMTPIYYYLKWDRYNFVGWDYAQAIRENPNSRIWVVRLPYLPWKAEMVDVLKEYHPQERIDALNIWTILYKKSLE